MIQRTRYIYLILVFFLSQNPSKIFAATVSIQLENVFNISDNIITKLSYVNAMTTGFVGSTIYRVVNTATDDKKSQTKDIEIDQTRRIGGVPYLFVGGKEDGIGLFRLSKEGNLSFSDYFFDSFNESSYLLRDIETMALADLTGKNYLFVGGKSDGVSTISVFKISSRGVVDYVYGLLDNPFFQMRGLKQIVIEQVDNTVYLFSASAWTDVINVFSIDSSGYLNHVQNIKDDSTLELNGVSTLLTVKQGKKTYLLAGGHLDDGISVFEILKGGKLKNRFNLKDNQALKLDGINTLNLLKINRENYIFAGSNLEDGISMFRLLPQGKLKNLKNVKDNDKLLLKEVDALATVKISKKNYLFAGGRDNGISVFEIGAKGSLKYLLNIVDDEKLELDGGVKQLSAIKFDEVNYLLASSYDYPGISVFKIGLK